MAITKNDGGPAFPFVEPVTECSVSTSMSLRDAYLRGINLRDWFAGQALQGMLSSTTNLSAAVFAERAYLMADVMLIERTRGGD